MGVGGKGRINLLLIQNAIMLRNKICRWSSTKCEGETSYIKYPWRFRRCQRNICQQLKGFLVNLTERTVSLPRLTRSQATKPNLDHYQERPCIQLPQMATCNQTLPSWRDWLRHATWLETGQKSEHRQLTVKHHHKSPLMINQSPLWSAFLSSVVSCTLRPFHPQYPEVV